MKTTTRFIAIVITLIVAFSCFATASASTFSERRYGDVNDDGKVTTTDAHRVLRYCAGLEGEEFASFYADVNASKTVTTADVRLILMVAAGIIADNSAEWSYLPNGLIFRKPA